MMATFTQQDMLKYVVEHVIDEYVKKKQMFTVYQIWEDSGVVNGGKLNYDFVRSVVESKINDCGSKIIGWTRAVHNIKNPNNTVGKAGESPQIYHPIGAHIKMYDPDFRLHNAIVGKGGAVFTKKPISKEVKLSGLFKFKVWHNGKLVPCSFHQIRGAGGKFVKNPDYQGYGILDNGSAVTIYQDNEGKLYAVADHG